MANLLKHSRDYDRPRQTHVCAILIPTLGRNVAELAAGYVRDDAFYEGRCSLVQAGSRQMRQTRWPAALLGDRQPLTRFGVMWSLQSTVVWLEQDDGRTLHAFRVNNGGYGSPLEPLSPQVLGWRRFLGGEWVPSPAPEALHHVYETVMREMRAAALAYKRRAWKRRSAPGLQLVEEHKSRQQS